MKRTYEYVEARDFVACDVDGETLSIPVLVGVLKHPSAEQLRELLARPAVVRKYTREALRKLPWRALRQFPHGWLRSCLDGAALSPSRRRAVEFMLDAAAARVPKSLIPSNTS